MVDIPVLFINNMTLNTGHIKYFITLNLFIEI